MTNQLVQPSRSNASSRFRASALPLRAAADSKIRVWSQFLATPRPWRKSSARSISAPVFPFSTAAQSRRIASGSSAALLGARSICNARRYSCCPVSAELSAGGGRVTWVSGTSEPGAAPLSCGDGVFSDAGGRFAPLVSVEDGDGGVLAGGG